MEKPFCEQLKGIGWDWLEGDTDVPEMTERENFREEPHAWSLGRQVLEYQKREGDNGDAKTC